VKQLNSAFEHQPKIRYQTSVRSFRNIWFALAALLWPLAHAHCQLETVTGLAFLQCAEAFPGSQADDKDCSDCCAMEKSQFRADASRPTAPQPEQLPTRSARLLIAKAEELPRTLIAVTAAPPDLPQRWRFLSRTALPVRAPSLVF
jgi:hypothetical protein